MIETSNRNNVSEPELKALTVSTVTACVDDNHNKTLHLDAPALITAFLVQVGKLLLKNDKQDWVDVDRLCQVAKKNDIHLEINNQRMGREQVENVLKDFFSQQEEMYSTSVNVVAYTRRCGWDDLFMLRFYKYNGQAGPVSMAAVHDAEPVTV